MYHQELDEMKEKYKGGLFCKDDDLLPGGQHHVPYNLKDGFIMMHENLCIMKQLSPNVAVESHAPPYVGHCEIDVTVKAVEIYLIAQVCVVMLNHS